MASALIGRILAMPVGRRTKRVPRNENRARLLILVEPQQHVGEAEDCTGGPVAPPHDGFRKRVISAVRKRVAFEHQERAALRSRIRAYPSGRCFCRGLFGCWHLAASLRRPKLHPNRCMIAGIRFTAHRAIDAGSLEALRKIRAEKYVVDPQSGVARPAVSHVVPERVDALVRM